MPIFQVFSLNQPPEVCPLFSRSRAPCCPAAINVSLVTQAMTNVSWLPGGGARYYMVSLTSSRGHAKCHTLDTHCLMGCITCSTSYSVNLVAISSTGHKSQCPYRGFSSSEEQRGWRGWHLIAGGEGTFIDKSRHFVLAGPCCPTNLKLYRMFNNTLRVRWRSAGPQIHNHTVDLYGTGANYTCTAAAGSRYCDIQEEICGEVYSVVVAPVGRSGGKVDFCQPRTYSGGSGSTSRGFGSGMICGHGGMDIMLLSLFSGTVLCPGSNAGVGKSTL